MEIMKKSFILVRMNCLYSHETFTISFLINEVSYILAYLISIKLYETSLKLALVTIVVRYPDIL